MEEFIHEFQDFCFVVSDILPQGFVIEAFQVGDDPVEHTFRENTMLSIDVFLLVQSISRFKAGTWQDGE